MLAVEQLEARQLLTTTYVDFEITNSTGPGGLTNPNTYIWLAGQQSTSTTAPQYPFSIDSTTGVASFSSAFSTTTLASLPAGSTPGSKLLRVESDQVIPSARLYFTTTATDPATGNPVIPVSGGVVTSFPPPSPAYNYDYVEFSLTAGSSANAYVLTVDTTQVDQFGLPITLNVDPADPLNTGGSGTIPGLTRETIFNSYGAAMNNADLAPFLDGFVSSGSATPGNEFYRILAPQHVIDSQLSPLNAGNATVLTVDMAVGTGSAGAWTTTLTITGPGANAPTNQGLAPGMVLFGAHIPAGTVVSSLPNYPNSQTVVVTSAATANPFTAARSGLSATFYQPPTTLLNEWFGPSVTSTTNLNTGNALDEFFAYWKARPGQLQIEVTSGGYPTVYSGSVVDTVTQTDIEGNTSTYTTLQFTGNNSGTSAAEVYNIFYPYFTTNSPVGKQDPFGNDVPAPPAWFTNTTNMNASPSQMVFAAKGVFADSAIRNPGGSNAYTGDRAALGSLENIVATALARGYATTWQTSQNATLTSASGQTATWQLQAGQVAALGLHSGMNVSSWKIFSVPMVISGISGDQITVTTTSTFDNVGTPLTDMLTFFEMYQPGEVWSAYAKYLHNLMGYDVFVGGRSYALPYDDNGGFSSTIVSDYDATTVLSGTTAARTTITLGPWAATSSALTVTTTADSGAGSLREAITTANASPEPDTITFALPADATISLESPLPFIGAPVTIDARPSGSWNGVPQVTLTTAAPGSVQSGLVFAVAAAGSDVYGLEIKGFSQGFGIYTNAVNTSVGGVILTDNLSGLVLADAAHATIGGSGTLGVTSTGNGFAAMYALGAMPGATVTNLTATGNPLGIMYASASGLVVDQSTITSAAAGTGIFVTGTSPGSALTRSSLSGGDTGAVLINATGFSLGGNATSTAALGNTFGGYGVFGVYAAGDLQGVTVAGNTFTDSAEGSSGIILAAATGAAIGTINANGGNTISNHNTGYGVYATGALTGTSLRQATISGAVTGLMLESAAGLAVGGTSSIAGISVSGCTAFGIYGRGTLTGTIITGSKIQTSNIGIVVNAGTGLSIGVAGYTGYAGGNLITQNTTDGVFLSGANTGSSMQGNQVLQNGLNGVSLTGVTGMLIGGTAAEAANLIQGQFSGWGLYATGVCTGSVVQANTITGNFISGNAANVDVSSATGITYVP